MIPKSIERSDFRVGWELETQSIFGATRDSMFTPNHCNRELTEQELENARESILHAGVSNLSDDVRYKVGIALFTLANGYEPDSDHPFWRKLDHHGNCASFCSSLQYVDTPVAVLLWIALGEPDTYSDAVRNGVRLLDSAATVFGKQAIAKRYRVSPSGMCDFYSDNGAEGLFSIEYDGTVGGIEIKPSEPLAPDESLARFTKLCELTRFVADDRCSFHVHVSVAGMEHQYGINMQAWMYLYILQNISRVPKGVLERWRKSALRSDGARYFVPELGGASCRDLEKRYAFVAFRNEFKTWEFRCWGNVSNPEDAKACVDLSVEAYLYAFDLVHKQKKFAPLNELTHFGQHLVEMAASYSLYG